MDDPSTRLRPLNEEVQEGGADAAAAEQAASAEGLVPLCVIHPDGPALKPDVYGYDLALITDKPWQKPGANINDYFNYGFNEDSWRAYCALQPHGAASLKAQTEEFLMSMRGGGQHSGMMMGQAPYGGAAFAMPSHHHPASYGRGGGGMGPPPGSMMMGPPSHGYPPQGGPMMVPPGGEGGPMMHGRPFVPRGGGGGGFGPMGGGMNYKTRICFAHRDGYCSRGDQCNYAHGEEELRIFRGAGGMGGEGAGGPPGGVGMGGYGVVQPQPSFSGGGPPPPVGGWNQRPDGLPTGGDRGAGPLMTAEGGILAPPPPQSSFSGFRALPPASGGDESGILQHTY